MRYGFVALALLAAGCIDVSTTTDNGEGGEAVSGYTLEVRVSNAQAIRLYERLGFEARGVRRGYYTDNREDALIMWREPASSEQAS